MRINQAELNNEGICRPKVIKKIHYYVPQINHLLQNYLKNLPRQLPPHHPAHNHAYKQTKLTIPIQAQHRTAKPFKHLHDSLPHPQPNPRSPPAQPSPHPETQTSVCNNAVQLQPNPIPNPATKIHPTTYRYGTQRDM